MDAIEKIRQEIERLMNERYNWETDGSSESVTACEALTKIYKFLDTIEEEPSEELEKAAEEYGNKHDSIDCAYTEIDEPVYIGDLMENAFIAGANWQKEQMMKKAAEEYSYVFVHQDDYLMGKNAVFAGANWQAKHMKDEKED